MTIRSEPTLWCDGIEDEDAPHGVVHALNCPHWTQNGQTAAQIRREARRDGWVRIGGRDYSPRCGVLARIGVAG